MNVVIDSLSRSGTTLFSSILNTHKDITATRGIFNECLSLTGWDVDWPKGLAKNPFFFEGDVYSRKSIKLQLIDKLPKKIKKHLILNIRKKNLYIDRDKFFDLKNYYKHRQNKNINQIELLKLINVQKKLNNFAPDNFIKK